MKVLGTLLPIWGKKKRRLLDVRGRSQPRLQYRLETYLISAIKANGQGDERERTQRYASQESLFLKKKTKRNVPHGATFTLLAPLHIFSAYLFS